MIERIYPRKVICRARKRPPALHVLAIVLIGMACLIAAAMQKAQATRNTPISKSNVELENHPHIAGSVTLAEMIELQRIKRARAAQPPASAGIAPVQAASRWEVQFGAFAAVPAARQLQTRLQAQSFGGDEAMIANIAGLYRVRSVAADRPAAERLCESAKAAGFACFVREL